MSVDTALNYHECGAALNRQVLIGLTATAQLCQDLSTSLLSVLTHIYIRVHNVTAGLC